MGGAYLNIERLKGGGIIARAARHNLREIQAELGANSHIDPARIRDNVVLSGPGIAEEVAGLAADMMQRANVGKLRKDAVRALEVLVALPRDYRANPIGFCREALSWVETAFSVPVLSAVIHLDEEEPHMHILLLPLVAGRMVGSDLVGGPRRLAELQTSFFDTVARKHGLSRPAKRKKASKPERTQAARMVLEALQNAPERLQSPEVAKVLTLAFSANPAPLLEVLGLAMPVNAVENLTRLMTRPVKPDKSHPAPPFIQAA